jgi:predicted permease
MEADIAIRTMVPILLLIGLGFLSRRIRVLKKGDERTLSAYVYYFALPALLLSDLARIDLIENLNFILAGILPILIVVAVYIFIYFVFRLSKDTLYLLILSTVFGSLAFFGLPFMIFAFPEEGEHFATLSVASISVVGVTISITVLELYKFRESTIWEGLRKVVKRLARNPLILSVMFGVLFSVTGIEIPQPIQEPLHMLGATTSTVAIFMLGVFLYGRRYTNLAKAFGLSLLRIALLPLISLLPIMLFGLKDVAKATLVIMNSVPVAISMIVLSERYDFHKETIASVILISSISAVVYLNLWLILLGYY